MDLVRRDTGAQCLDTLGDLPRRFQLGVPRVDDAESELLRERSGCEQRFVLGAHHEVEPDQVERQVEDLRVDALHVAEVEIECGLDGQPLYQPRTDRGEGWELVLVLEDRRFVELDRGRPGLLQRLRFLVQRCGQGGGQRLEGAVMLVDREARQRVGAGEHGLHRLGAVLDGEGVIIDGDRLAPGDVALDDRLAVVHVRVEPAGQPVQRDAGELAREVGLFVLPADLAVRHEVQARFGLFLDHLDRHLVQDVAHLFLADLTAVESVEHVAQASGTRPVGDLWIAASDGGDHVRPFWTRACAYEDGRSYDPRADGVLERQHS